MGCANANARTKINIQTIEKEFQDKKENPLDSGIEPQTLLLQHALFPVSQPWNTLG